MDVKRSNIQRLSNPTAHSLSVAGFVALMILMVGSVYYATNTIEYIWRWYKIPQYFMYIEDIKIYSDSNGSVKEIRKNGEKFDLIIVDGLGEHTYTVPADSFDLSEGDFTSHGDVLAEYPGGWKPGLLAIGLWTTLRVSIIATIMGIVLGIIGGVARVSSTPILKWTAITYVEIIRGSPLLVQIMIAYFVLGTTINKILMMNGFSKLNAEWYGIAALAVFTGAYVVEIVRAGIESIPPGQVEAARSGGMNYFQSMYYIILPQALKTILPPLAGQFINLIKDSSLLGMIAIRELTKATREGITTSLQTFELWMLCAALYLIITFSLSMAIQYLERRTSRK